jgi:hypothetical protein
MSHDKMIELSNSKRQYDDEVARARHAKLPPGFEDAVRLLEMGTETPSSPPAGGVDLGHIRDADAECRSRHFDQAFLLYDEAVASVRDDPVPLARALTAQAHCHRRSLDPLAALAAVEAALDAVPYLCPALFEKGLALLDTGRPVEAIDTFATLAVVNASWPAIQRWLVHAHARARHRGIGPVDGAVADGYVFGARVRTVAAYDGLWAAGDGAAIVGLGSVNAPILIMFDKNQKVINTQREHLELISSMKGVEGGNGDGGSEDSASSGEDTAATPFDHFSALGNLPADFSDSEFKRG